MRATDVRRGTVLLDPLREDDLVDVVEVAAPDDPRRLLLPRLRRRERPHRAPDAVPLPPWAMRLAREVAIVRRRDGDRGWLLSFADDGRTIRATGLALASDAPARRRPTLGVDRDGRPVDMTALEDALRRVGLPAAAPGSRVRTGMRWGRLARHPIVAFRVARAVRPVLARIDPASVELGDGEHLVAAPGTAAPTP